MVGRRGAFWSIVGLLLVGGGAWWTFGSGTSDVLPSPLQAAKIAQRQSDPAAALRLAQAALNRDPIPDDEAAFLLAIAVDSCLRLERWQDAEDFSARLPAPTDPQVQTAWLQVGESCLEAGRLSAAERVFRTILEHAPRHTQATRRLSFVLRAENRRWESLPLLLELVRQNVAASDELMVLGDPSEAVDYAGAFPHGLDPSRDTLALLGPAGLALFANRVERAGELAKQVIAAHPDLVEAHAILGAALLELAPEQLPAWYAALPPNADTHPEVWYVFAVTAERAEQIPAARRAYWEALKLNPNHSRACFRLARLAREAGDTRAADELALRAERLDDLSRVLHNLVSTRSAGDMVKLARLLVPLGRVWEARSWYRVAMNQYPDSEAAAAGLKRVTTTLPELDRLPLCDSNPALALDYSGFPRLDLGRGVLGAARSDVAAGGPIRFADAAEANGLNFTYFNGDPPGTPVVHIYRELGGGIGVLDFDGDSWPDLYLGQGCEWPPDETRSTHRDRLFRNHGGRTAHDVTVEAGLGDTRYTQGATVGDYDQDGFPDLYIGNIGVNRLYRNNGDGTFSDVTTASGITGNRWTTSVLMADLNGDSLPDIYDVTYLAGREPFDIPCIVDGRVYACAPTGFAGELDRVYINQGDGRFTDQTESSGIVAPAGKGLGIVAADLDGSGRLSLFVANDGTPNFLFLNQTPSRGGTLTFVEKGQLAGVATDGNGRSQASMGIACGDANQDFSLDFYVTNFYLEGSTLYTQSQPTAFEDSTAPAGLRDSTLEVLGFGTQFIDADLDGLEDLVVANGHVGDYRFQGHPYRMRAQFFHNLGEGRFTELPGADLGAYFAGEWLGRSLARLDWDRDGRMDFAVCRLDDPLALVTNQTPRDGNWISLELRGIKANRDAIGTVLEATTGVRRQVFQLTAGDGFQASNERRLIIGLGAAEKVDRLRVRWPDGELQELPPLAAGRSYLLVQGREPVSRPAVEP